MKTWLAALCATCAFAAPLPASAASAVVTVTATTLVFDPTLMTSTALTATPVTATASVTFTTTAGGAGGTVTVIPTSLVTSPAGGTLDARDFTLTCKRTSGSTGFVAAPSAILNGVTTCGTLTQGKNNAVATFSIELTLNATAAATVPFGAATYFGTFTVSATAS